MLVSKRNPKWHGHQIVDGIEYISENAMFIDGKRVWICGWIRDKKTHTIQLDEAIPYKERITTAVVAMALQ